MLSPSSTGITTASNVFFKRYHVHNVNENIQVHPFSCRMAINNLHRKSPKPDAHWPTKSVFIYLLTVYSLG